MNTADATPLPLRLFGAVAIACGLQACSNNAQAINLVAGDLITLTAFDDAPNGAWSWFEDERAIIDDSVPGSTKLLVSSVSYAPSGSERGDIDLLWYDIDSGEQGRFELNNRLEVPDDHNSAALYRRTDGRYLAMYSTHNNDDLTRYRISTNPGDPTSWGPEQIVDNNAPTTYSNVYYLPNDRGGDGRLYNFTRATNFDPTILVSNDEGSSWTSSGFKLVTEGTSSQRPYAVYTTDGEKIHVTVTEQHPRNFNNSIYHGYIQDAQLFSSTGALIDSNLLNGAAVRPDQLTPVFNANSTIGGDTLTRAWTTDVAIDGSGNPVTVFTARVNDDDDDHRLLYARFENGGWQVEQLAKAGGFLYSPENDYTGLASIDPNDTSVVFISTDIDPRTDQQMDYYEIFRGTRNDATDTWGWDPITFDSTMDNLRPLVPEWNETDTAVAWMRGDYRTFLSWDSEVVALTEITSLTAVPSVADFDGVDGVTLLDYEFFLRNMHTNVTGLDLSETILLGDFDGDRDIDYDDLLTFRSEYERFNGTGALALDSQAAPEPSALAFAVVSVASALAARGRSRR